MNCWCCAMESCNKRSSKVSTINEMLSGFAWNIQKVEGVEKQEEMYMKFLKAVVGVWDIDKLAEKCLDLEKKMKMKRMEQEDKDECDDSMDYGMFEEIFETEDEENTENEEDEE